EDTNGDMWSLDKDILFPGNKIYSVNTCCFVPNRVNKFFTSRKNYRSKYGIGVYKQKESNTYFSLISVNAESKSSFGYTTPFDAQGFWFDNKISAAKSIREEFEGKNDKLCSAIDRYIQNLIDV